MPAMCGAAIDVPLIVLNVAMSVSPGPLRGSRPVEQIGKVGRQDEVMFSPGAEMSGQVDGSAEAPREEESLTTPSRVPVSWSWYEATDRMPPVGSWPAGLVIDVEPSPPSLPAAQTVTTPSAASARCSFTVAESGSKEPPPVGP